MIYSLFNYYTHFLHCPNTMIWCGNSLCRCHQFYCRCDRSFI